MSRPDFRTLRWGGQETIVIRNTETTAVRNAKSQLAQLTWEVPLSWVVMLVMNPSFDPAETHTFTAVWTVTFGVGQATVTGGFTYTFAPNAGVYTPVTDQRFLAGQDIQISFSLLGTVTPGITSQESFNVGCIAAPNNADVIGEYQRWREQNEPNPEKKWMPGNQFTEEPLSYSR